MVKAGHGRTLRRFVIIVFGLIGSVRICSSGLAAPNDQVGNFQAWHACLMEMQADKAAGLSANERTRRYNECMANGGVPTGPRSPSTSYAIRCDEINKVIFVNGPNNISFDGTIFQNGVRDKTLSFLEHYVRVSPTALEFGNISTIDGAKILEVYVDLKSMIFTEYFGGKFRTHPIKCRRLDGR